MLNLLIAMLKLPIIFALFFWLQAETISITSPQPGDTLRGQVEILGNMDVPNFASAELAFSYASNPADSWFTIQTYPQPVQNPTLAVWDTTAVTDGDYILHLRVFLLDGSSQDIIVSDLKVRNEEPITTVTPTSTEAAEFFVTSVPPTSTRQPEPTLQTFSSPTPMPPNPASVTSSSIYINFGRGALIVLVLFFFVGIIFRFRSKA